MGRGAWQAIVQRVTKSQTQLSNLTLALAFLPGESHGQRSLVGYSPKGHKESDTTERLSTQHEYCLERFKKINMFNTN